jgi:hypothetical protein
MSYEEMVMSDYTIEKIENGVATIRYPDQSWAEIVLTADMTEEQLDQEAWNFKPKVGLAPAFVTAGSTRTASPLPAAIVEEEPVLPEWLQNRNDAYGDVSAQIEYITENGLEAWQAHVAEIKAQYPKE